MKNVAVISPVGLLEEFSTRYHLVLTQYCIKYPAYLDFYCRRKRAGDFVILDNGAAELKTSSPGQALFETARLLKPDLVVAPDKIYDGPATLRMTADFMREYEPILRRFGCKILAIPQGSDMAEWSAVFGIFNEDPRIDWLGISMFYTPKFGRRLSLLKAISTAVTKPCHLFGLWNDVEELKSEGAFPFVRSVDTAKAVEFAIEGLTMTQWKYHKHIDDDWYFDLQSLTDEQRRLAHHNIKTLQESLNAGSPRN